MARSSDKEDEERDVYLTEAQLELLRKLEFSCTQEALAILFPCSLHFHPERDPDPSSGGPASGWIITGDAVPVAGTLAGGTSLPHRAPSRAS